MSKKKGHYAGSTGRVSGGVQLSSASPRTFDGVTFMPGVVYPADDPVAARHRMHFRIAKNPADGGVAGVEPAEVPTTAPAPALERLADPDE
tara:strand:+ start:34966 stop:35238 length:273 start_codon:yes stop_codon:yes gene_type:complete